MSVSYARCVVCVIYRACVSSGVLMGRHSTCHPACRFKNTHISTKHCKVSVVQRRLLLASQGDESNDTPSLELSPSDGAPECRYVTSADRVPRLLSVWFRSVGRCPFSPKLRLSRNRYGVRCYRKNPQHLKQFKHPSFEVVVEDTRYLHTPPPTTTQASQRQHTNAVQS